MSEPQDDLPRAHIKRIVKAKLTALMNEGGPDAKGNKAPDGHVQKEALLAFGECAKIFIHILPPPRTTYAATGRGRRSAWTTCSKLSRSSSLGSSASP